MGHALSRVESNERCDFSVVINRLQLGHALSRVERAVLTIHLRDCNCSFNWATRSRAWKASMESTCHRARAWLQLGHALSRVESGVRCCAGPAPRSFNWATRSRAWKVANCTESGHYQVMASIGPRALARGKLDFLRRYYWLHFCFNWATRSRAWKGRSTGCARA